MNRFTLALAVSAVILTTATPGLAIEVMLFAGDDGTDLATRLGANWNTEFECSAITQFGEPAVFDVEDVFNICGGGRQRARQFFVIPGSASGDTLVGMQPYCVNGQLRVEMFYSAPPYVDVTNSTKILGELVVSAYSTKLAGIEASGPPVVTGVVPTYGETGAIVAGIGLLLGGAFLIQRFGA